MTNHPVDPSLAATALRVLPLIDLTSLGEADTDADIDALCQAATTPFGTVAAVCVWPRFVERASANVADTDIAVAGVANFPQGDLDPGRAVADALQIVSAAGTEVDVVYPWTTLRDSGKPSGGELIALVREAIPQKTVLKVILETGELEDPALIQLAALDSVAAGADFLKTSTGKTIRSATPAAVQILCQVARDADRAVGVKVSGGVRTVADAGQYLNIADEVFGADWVHPAHFRIGASSLLGDVLSELDAANRAV